MDMNYEIGETIATRELYLTEDDGTKRVIVIRLGKPRTFPDSSPLRRLDAPGKPSDALPDE
jgi:hypothetical protein